MLSCLHNIIYGDDDGELSKLLMNKSKNKNESFNIIGTLESILINRIYDEYIYERVFSILSLLIKNNVDVFIEKMFIRNAFPNTLLS